MISGVRANFIAVSATVVGVLPLFLVGGLSVYLRSDLGFSLSALGLLAAIYFAASALFSSVAGAVVETLGHKRGLIASVSTSVLTLFAIGWLAGQWAHLAILLAIAGLANATTQVSSNLLLARSVVSHRQGLAYGVKQAAIPIGTLLAGASVGSVATGVGWRVVFVIGGVVGMTVLAAVLAVPHAASRRSGESSRLHMTQTRTLVVLAIAAALASGVANTLGTFLVESLVEWIPHEEAGSILVIGSMSGIAARVGSGWIVDRTTFNPLLLGFFQLVVAVGAYATLSVATTRPVALAATMVAFATGWGWTGVLTYAAATRYWWAPAKSTGITQAGIYVGAVMGPPAFGFVAERATYATAWTASAGVVAVAAVTLAVGIRLMGREDPASTEGREEQNGERARPPGSTGAPAKRPARRRARPERTRSTRKEGP